MIKMNRYNFGVIGDCSFLAFIDKRLSHIHTQKSEFCYTYLFHRAGSKAAINIKTLNKNSNHLGLFSEDADEKFGQWGNFPRTYSHVGLVNAVYRLSTKLGKPIFL
jgi:GH15 family glucan-1,4-alpha-glucosidase